MRFRKQIIFQLFQVNSSQVNESDFSECHYIKFVCCECVNPPIKDLQMHIVWIYSIYIYIYEVKMKI